MNNKGMFKGICNRSACNNHRASWINKSTKKYYCTKCAHGIMNYPENAGLLVQVSSEEEGEQILREYDEDTACRARFRVIMDAPYATAKDILTRQTKEELTRYLGYAESEAVKRSIANILQTK